MCQDAETANPWCDCPYSYTGEFCESSNAIQFLRYAFLKTVHFIQYYAIMTRQVFSNTFSKKNPTKLIILCGMCVQGKDNTAGLSILRIFPYSTDI